MRVLAVILLAAFCFTATLAKITTEDEVLVITKDNFDEAIQTYDYILFEFYAPWCGHCKALAPEYVKTAKKLAEIGSEVKLAKIDATVATSLVEEHGITGYPTIKFYRKGTYTIYNGSRRSEDIVNWLLKRTGSPAKNLTSVEEAKSFIDAHKVSIVGFFKNLESDEAKVFLEAGAVNDHVFGISDNDEVFKEYKVEDGKVVLFKKFDEGKVEFEGEFTVDNLNAFISVQSLPLLIEFNQETAQTMFYGENNGHLLIFLSKEAKHHEKYLDEFIEPAKKFRGKVLFVSIDSDDVDHERIMDFFGLKKEHIPAMRLVQLDKYMSKFKPEKPELTAENTIEFVNAVLDGKLKNYLITQDPVEDWDKHPVKILVGSNFHKVAFDKSKSVLVEFYAPWCGHCQNLAPIYAELGEKYKDREDLIIAKMDVVANELEDIKIDNYPTIILYKKDTNEAVEYTGYRTLKGLSKFVDTDGAYVEDTEETQEEDENDDVPRKDEL